MNEHDSIPLHIDWVILFKKLQKPAAPYDSINYCSDSKVF